MVGEISVGYVEAILELFELSKYGEPSAKLTKVLSAQIIIDATCFGRILVAWDKEIKNKGVELHLMACCVYSQMGKERADESKDERFAAAAKIFHQINPAAQNQNLSINVCQVAAFGRICHPPGGGSEPFNNLKEIFNTVKKNCMKKRKDYGADISHSVAAEHYDDVSNKRPRSSPPSASVPCSSDAETAMDAEFVAIMSSDSECD